jgi:Kdo2-lipid IVA lauroyltransferase/acyltransferase
MTEESEGKELRSARLFLAGMNRIPLRWRIFFFERFARLLFILDGRHRRIALRNLALAFPEKRAEERKEIARSAFSNMGRVSAEFTYTPRLKEGPLDSFIYYEGGENVSRAHQKGRGIIFLTAHFGNWEWMAAGFPLAIGQNCHVVFRPLDSPFLDGVVEQVRTSTGNRAVPKQKAMGQILRLLRAGKAVGILLDQNMAWQEGVFVDFFGEKACTNTGMALLALKTGAAVLPVFNVREKDGRYRVIFEPEVPLVRTGNKDVDVVQNTQLFTRVIERYIRDHPDHWLWIHQRWKTRPWQAKPGKGE